MLDDMEEFMDEMLGDLDDDCIVLNLLLYLWLERGVEFLSSDDGVLGDEECTMCFLHPEDDEKDDSLTDCFHLGV